ncbi:antirestriction protein ArdA [uncultured Jatrophihabitans sp.]|uniref:antirestriction protein ArdA n=1 Tax=uncultured Jatrophihabitans sp. TaxID=1610747 RepID=UPI0035CC6C01
MNEQNYPATLEADQEPAVPLPEIWVGSLEDYTDGQRYGAWLDAGQRTPDIVAQIRAIVDRTPDALGKRWRVCDLRGFGGWQPAEHEGLRQVLDVARGIAIHGQAYGALAARLGADSNAVRLDNYPKSYIGGWPSLTDFVATVARESGWYEQLDRLPTGVRPYVRFDLDALAAAAQQELTVIDHPDGVWVYDPRLW